ncbi:MAG TPA: hypothetical protein VIK11_03970 [Tepidiformaceae bacterium]
MSIRQFAFVFALVLAGSLLPLVGGPGNALAADPPQATTLKVVQPADQQPGKPVLLSAKLTNAAGQPVGNQTINFYIIPGVFGPDAMMSAGRAVTDSTGTAEFPYTPTWIGDVKAAVSFNGTATLAGSQATFQFKAVGPVRGHTNAKFGLQAVRDWAPWVVAALVAIIWGTFITVVVRVAIAMRSGGPKSTSPTTAGESLAGAKP